MTRGLFAGWRGRGGRRVRILLPFADIMEVALALLALTPDELAALGWSFDARKRLLEHFLIAGRQGDTVDREALDRMIVPLRLSLRDLRRLRMFARRELPKTASRPEVIDRLEAALDAAAGDDA